MRVTYTVAGDIYEFDALDDAECRELNGDWCVKVDGQMEYVGDEQPEFRVQAE